MHATIGVVDQSVVWPLLLEGHHESRERQFGSHMITHGPADDLAAVEVHDGRQVQPTLTGRNVGDVGEPDPVRRRGHEVSIDQVGAIGRS